MRQQTFAEAVAAYIEAERLKETVKPRQVKGGCVVYDLAAHREHRR